MPQTETKYTAGAERAARQCQKMQWSRRLTDADIAEIISRETHDAEMLEALKACYDTLSGGSYHNAPSCELARQVIAKVEGK